MERWPRQVSRWLPQLTLAGAVLILVAAGSRCAGGQRREHGAVYLGRGGEPDAPTARPAWVPHFVSRTVTFDVKTQALTWRDEIPTPTRPGCWPFLRMDS
jgi:prohibitin 2